MNHIKCEYKILGTIRDWIPSCEDYFAVGLAKPQDREVVVNILKEKGAKFATLITPASMIQDSVEIGEGCVISNCIIDDNAKLGNFVHAGVSVIGQDAVVGDYCTLGALTNITNARLGKRVFVGTQSAVLNNLKIGDDAFVGAGSIVVRNIQSGVKVMGNPAKKIEF